MYIIYIYIYIYIYIHTYTDTTGQSGHRVSRRRGTGSVGDSVGEGMYTHCVRMIECVWAGSRWRKRSRWRKGRRSTARWRKGRRSTAFGLWRRGRGKHRAQRTGPTRPCPWCV